MLIAVDVPDMGCGSAKRMRQCGWQRGRMNLSSQCVMLCQACGLTELTDRRNRQEEHRDERFF